MSGVSFCDGQLAQAAREARKTAAAAARKRCTGEDRDVLGAALMFYATYPLQLTDFMLFDHVEGES